MVVLPGALHASVWIRNSSSSLSEDWSSSQASYAALPFGGGTGPTVVASAVGSSGPGSTGPTVCASGSGAGGPTGTTDGPTGGPTSC
eukprot:CAMPEP_0183543488 /NCGR_PEP_ID=MMETSP0371-20130417/45384_1 /TAXON_ID=268820 /ORGANISM="Peridinium aciculiferum, Strain PAER-2" /LENGTH=86 /DNA_ID=CAMNT_0025744975 /DNA_START=86 /DNA_END=343 /DNA_ORIENTATION=-